VRRLGQSIKKSIGVIKKHDEAIARWISHVISPHFAGVTLTSIMALNFGDNPLNDFLWLLLLMPLLVVPPLLYLLWLVHLGQLEDIYMPNRETRVRPTIVMIAWLILCLGLIRYWQAPLVVELFVSSAVLLAGVLTVVTLFWKISFHGATITFVATTTMMVAGSAAWPVMLLVPLVGWARIRLKRHTPRQVIFGSLVGALIALVFAHGLLLELVER
jgi:membrane-associated phospholipid phosphatase